VLDAAGSVEVKPGDVRPGWTDEMPSGDTNVCETPRRLNSNTNMTTSNDDTTMYSEYHRTTLSMSYFLNFKWVETCCAANHALLVGLKMSTPSESGARDFQCPTSITVVISVRRVNQP